MSDQGIKRRRLVLSCFECKRRKLRCDRQLPICSRCIDVGHPEYCRYDPRYFAGIEMEMPDLDDDGQSQTRNDLQYQRQTLSFDDFESAVALGEDGQTTFPLSFQLDHELDSPHYDIEPLLAPCFAGASYFEDAISSLGAQQRAGWNHNGSLNGRFKGPSNSTSIITSFQGILEFLRKTVQDHHVLGALKWSAYAPKTSHSLPSYSKGEVDRVLKNLLPPKPQCHQYLQSYFDHFAGVCGVVHVPWFWKQYNNFWGGTHSEPAWFNALLLSAMSCSRCLSVADPLSFDGDSSTSREEAIQWLHAVESWQKYWMAEKTTIEAFQIRCLVLFSKTVNDIDSKEQYTASQTLLADAISTGLHRDWKVLGRGESIFEQETRRKIWATIAELDIARCIEHGVPSTVSNLFTDVGRPSNYHDRDYDETTKLEPQAQLDNQFTESSFKRFAHSLRSIRYHVNTLVNNPQKHSSLSQAQLLALWQQTTQLLSSIPDWSEPAPGEERRNQALIHRALLRLYLHEVLLLLHLPFALGQNGYHAVDTDYQRFICIKSASMIVKIYEQVAQQGLSQIALPRASLLRAGLSLCLTEADGLNYGVNLLPSNPPSRNNLVSSALGMVDECVLALGTDLQGLWLFSAASCYTQVFRDPSSTATLQKRITEHIISLFTKMCLSQELKSHGSSSEDHFARYIVQIQQTCEMTGLGPQMMMRSEDMAGFGVQEMGVVDFQGAGE